MISVYKSTIIFIYICSKFQPKKRKYTEKILIDSAITAISNGTSIHNASRMYKIPHRTLLIKFLTVSNRILTKSEDELFVKWILDGTASGFPVTKLQLLSSVKELVIREERPNCFKNETPGREWYASFMQSHPEISSHVLQNVSKCAAPITQEKIKNWFNEIYVSI